MSDRNFPLPGSTSISILADPLSVEGIEDSDAEGHVPLEILQRGTRIIIPLWAEPGSGDELWVMWRQNSIVTRIFYHIYDPPATGPFIYVPLTSQQMVLNGEAFIYYQIWKRGGGNSDDSPERKLTIDHTAPKKLSEPSFPHATLWGYINNKTVPPLLQGVTVKIAPLINIGLPNDRAVIQWQGYSSLNGSGAPVGETFGSWNRTLSQSDINNGFELVVPFDPCIRPLFDNDSALVMYRLLRNGRLIGESDKGLVKIDRVTPGQVGQSGLSVKGDKEMTVKIVPLKLRLNATRSGAQTVDASVDKLADDSIPISVLDSGIIVFYADNLDDPQDNDEIDVMYGKVGGPLVRLDRTYELGLAAGRVYPVEIEVPSNLFPEESTPATPTRYVVKFELFKAGGGNADNSNEVEFAIDRTAPFEVKAPARRKNPPTPAVAISNLPAAPGRIWDEVWMAANPQLKCTVPVGYPLRRLDDKLTYQLISGATVLEVFKDVVPATGAFDVDTAILRDLPNLTRISHAYSWEDLPGNVSARSAAAPIFDLRLAQDPLLLAPLVPKTDPDGSIHIYLDDMVLNDVFAIVKQPLHGIPTDDIKLIVEDAGDPTIFVDFGIQPLGTTDVRFHLTYAGKLETVFGDATEPKEVKVWYEHIRGGVTLDSPGTFIYLEFQHAGLPNPNLPDLTNPDLAVVTVTGASNTDNTILPGDRDQPGNIKVPVWFGLPDVVGGEEIDFWINDLHAGNFLPFGGETEFSATLSAAFIAALPTGTVEAYWTIKFAGSDKNIIKSLPQTVTVNARKIDLPTPTIRIRSRDEIACFAMDNVSGDFTLAMTIPKDAVNLPPNKTVTVFFEAFTDAAGTAPISGTRDSQPYVIKAAGTGDIAQVGSAVKFKLAQPVRGAVAFGKYWYETDIGGTQTSVPVIKPFDIINTSFDYCDRLPAPAAP
jgi:hypothetical protein